jgi:glycosyltransferase involved in cell wall biosynthesis
MSSEPKRAWRIVHSESSPESGGEERRILAELKGFQGRGNTVALLALSWSWVYGQAQAISVPVQVFSSNRLLYPWAILSCALWLRRFRPDVLNTHSSRDAWILGLAGRLARVPFIIRTRHFDLPLRNTASSRFVYEHLADHLITTSPAASARFMETFGWPPQRVTTLPTGVDSDLFVPNGPSAKLPAIEPASLPRIGMIGVLRGSKGHDVFLDAVKLLRDSGFQAQFFIVGEGPMRPGIEHQIQAQQLGPCVTLTGHREDIPEVLRALDLLVIPSRHEGVPQVGLQALATQTPVIGSNVGGIPEIVQPGKTGRLFPVGDSAALARTIQEALSDQASTRSMAKRGRALVEQQYSLSAMLDCLESLYARHLGSATVF